MKEIQKYHSEKDRGFLKEIEKSQLVEDAYSRMENDRRDYINLTYSFVEKSVPELSPHTFGELVLKKGKGLYTRYYDADMPFTFLSKASALEMAFHKLDKEDIEKNIKNWVENGVSYGDSTVSYYHPELLSE
jgi:hypothetical protein